MNDKTQVDPVEFHYQQILKSEELGHKKSKASTTQGIMVALALADRRYAEPSWQEEPVVNLVKRLDKPQLEALKRFREERGL